MMFGKPDKEPISKMTVAVGGLVLAGLLYTAVTAIPELVRYLRIRRM
jgi:hypothetical protein